MDATDAAGFDGEAFGRAVGRFAAGVTVVTTQSALGLRGITASSFSFVSLAPPLVLVCIVATSSFVPTIAESGAFAVNVLPEDDEFLADRFANRAPLVNATFSGLPHRTAITGAPLLRDAVAWFDCRLHATYPGGDHQIFVGEVVAFGEGDGEPLLVYRSRYARLTI
ncbi:MAG: flavin reductase family protein [Chloroflexota bacterium]|nr:flavin reductase family protein [Chloroflexota bacterium]